MHIIETFVDIVQLLVVGNKLVYPKGTLEVICMSALIPTPSQLRR
jgi:hypothetical protein